MGALIKAGLSVMEPHGEQLPQYRFIFKSLTGGEAETHGRLAAKRAVLTLKYDSAR